LSLVSQLARLCGMDDVHWKEPQNDYETEPIAVGNISVDNDDIFDVLRMSTGYGDTGTKRRRTGKVDDNTEPSLDFDFTEPLEEINREVVEDVEDELSLDEMEEHNVEINEPDVLNASGSKDQIGESEVERRRRRAKDKMQRAQANLERKKRMLKQARQQELEVFYERERNERERAAEKRELKVMHKEDLRSKFAEDFRIECQIIELSKEIAKEKAIDLKALRRQDAIKKVEEQIARKRSERIEKRRLEAELLIEKISSEELILKGMNEGGYSLPNRAEEGVNVAGTLQSSHRIMRDLMECRQKYVDAIKRQNLMQEKFDLFVKQLQTVENEERRLRRAIRLIEINPSIVGAEMSAESQLHELRSALINKQESLAEMQSLVIQRQKQLYVTNRSVQVLKLASKERDVLMATRIKELYTLEAVLTKGLKAMKMEKETVIVEKDKYRMKVIQHQKRIDALAKELLRVQTHKGRLIDTDVWVEGVMQRCVTSELIEHLKTEELKADTCKAEVVVALDAVRKRAFDLSEIIAQKKRDCDKVGNVAKLLQRQYKKFSSISVEQMMINLKMLQQKAEQVEHRRVKETDLNKLLAQSSTLTLVDKVRMKEGELRTKDERQFVGIDLILNPNDYLHLSPMEAEQMQFDDDYQCALSKPDLDRIFKLPEQINLALPFLLTAEEINAHRLMNKFYRNKDELYFKNKDYLCLSSVASVTADNNTIDKGDGANDDDTISLAGSMFDEGNIHEAWKSVTGGGSDAIKDLDEAEMVHDILLRESLRDRLRSAFNDESLSEDEKRWLKLDIILAPHVFGLDEENTLSVDMDDTLSTQPVAKTTSTTIGLDGKRLIGSLANSVVWPVEVDGKPNSARFDSNGRPRKVDPLKEGDMYQSVREQFDSGEDLFDYDWHCPYNKKQLLEIHRRDAVDLTSDFDRTIKELLNKYYVSDEESVMGHARFSSLRDLSQKINQVMFDADDDAEFMMESNRKEYAASMDQQSASLPTVGNSNKQAPQSDLKAQAGGDRKSPPTASNNFGDEEEITRIWGSWQQVHPASQGKLSQSSYFRLSTFNITRDHPASFALKPEESDDENNDAEGDDDEDMSLFSAVVGGTITARTVETSRVIGLQTLTSEPSVSSSMLRKKRKDPTALYFICESIQHLSQQSARKIRNKIVLLQVPDTMTLHEENDVMIQARQSKSHYFQVPDRENVRVLDITVSVVFQGTFSTHGYKLGRLAAALFKLPPDAAPTTNQTREEGQGSSPMKRIGVPIPIGYTPHDQISPNLPNSMGKIVIIHKPKEKPITPGSFQIVIGSAAQSKYSIQVIVHYAKAALPVLDEAIVTAKHIQSRLPLCLAEMDSVAESLRLAERKLLVCEKLIQEAELECDRCQKGIRIASTKLARDEEEMMLFEDERRELQRELDIFEIEYSQWAQCFTSRCREKEDIRRGIQVMYKFQRQREQEKQKISVELEEYRRDLPSCLLVLRNMTEAVNLAASLNTVVTGISEEEGAAAGGDFGGIRFSTPADDVRRLMKHYGFDSMSVEEQQWCLLDQALNPGKYEWQREQEDKERKERELLGKKKTKKKKINPALEPFM
jgi:hypothetical protein